MWAGKKDAEIPPEYVERILCREWSCTPLEVRQHDQETILMHMQMLNTEKRVKRFRDQKATGK